MAEFIDAPEQIQQGVLDVQAKNAQWASTFMPSANMSQRRKYREDIAINAANQLAQREAMQRQEMARSQVAQNLYFNSKDEDRKRVKFAADLRENQLDYDHKEQRLKSELETESAQRAAARALEDDRIQRTRFAAETAQSIKAANGRVLSEVEKHRKAGVLPGSREYKELIAEQLALNPGISKEWRASFRDSAQLDDDELTARITEIQKTLPRASVSITRDGQASIKNPGEKPQSDFDARFGASVRGLQAFEPAMKSAGLSVDSTPKQFKSAVVGGKMSQEDADAANHWATKFREANGSDGSKAVAGEYLKAKSRVGGSAPAQAQPAQSTEPKRIRLVLKDGKLVESK